MVACQSLSDKPINVGTRRGYIAIRSGKDTDGLPLKADIQDGNALCSFNRRLAPEARMIHRRGSQKIIALLRGLKAETLIAVERSPRPLTFALLDPMKFQTVVERWVARRKKT